MDGDYVSRLQRFFVPAKQAYRRRASRFASPMGDVSVVIFHVEQEHGMWIGPQEFRHRGVLHDNYFVRFVGGTSVMREHGDANRGKKTQQG